MVVGGGGGRGAGVREIEGGDCLVHGGQHHILHFAVAPQSTYRHLFR